MATIQHSNLTGSEIHEPKGVDTAGAKQFYMADGAGSGTWKDWPTGWGYYQDAGSAQVFSTTAAKLSIDGAGSLTNESYLPIAIRGSGSLWDTTSDKITPILLGDKYDIRVDLPVTAKSGTPTELTVQFDIGGGATPTIVILSRFLSPAKTPPYTITFGMPLTALSATTVSNGIQMFVYTDTGTVTVTNPSITIGRDHAGDF
jgi:hypothetical protein